ncbi:cupin domain-containing protein [Streptomyces sp. NPDC087300]|uniref:cupin domain-containing protein n=1 Tax=Streptomyces sp. NPDC087300 TaxID=3365780 RepID=UPI0037F367B7
MIVTDSRAASVTRRATAGDIIWRTVARRGMLFSECEAVDHLALDTGGTLASRPDDGTDLLWYVLTGGGEFETESGPPRALTADDAALVPAGAAVRLTCAEPTTLLVVSTVPERVSRRLPRRAPCM